MPSEGRSRWQRHAEASPVARADDEDEQQPVGDRWHDERIGGHDLADLVGQERSPRLEWWRKREDQRKDDGEYESSLFDAERNFN
jgi:hypothetical protein